METSRTDAVRALVAWWVHGTGVPRLKGPPRIFLLAAPVPGLGSAEVVATPSATRSDQLAAGDWAAADEPADDGVVPTASAARAAFFRERTARAKAAAESKAIADAEEVAARRAEPPAAPEPLPARSDSRGWAPELRPPEPDLTIRRTIQSPDPWSIMPSRTLRGAGARHLQRRADPLEAPETLEERVSREGPDAPAPATTVALWDLLIVPTQAGFRASDQGVKALVLYLDRSQLLRSPTVSTLEEFVGSPQHASEDYWKRRLHGVDGDVDSQIISLTPGVFSHQIFYEGPAPAEGALIAEAHIGHRTKSRAVPFGPSDREAAFWLALIGCRYDHVSRGFLERMHSILYLRPVLFAVPHTPDVPIVRP